MVYAQKLNKIPDFLPVPGQDVFNYLAADYASNHQLHMVITFEGHLCQELLAKSFRLTMDIEPVLGCRFDEQPESACWKRRTDLDYLNLCPVLETEQPEKELRDFIALPTDSRKDPLVQAKIFRTQCRDILCIKMDHACSDGGGLKEYVYLLSEVYNHQCSQRPYPVPLNPTRCDGRRFLKQFGIEDPSQAWDPSQTPPGPIWSFPCKSYRNTGPAFIKRSISRHLFHSMKAFAEQQRVTINDLLLTAYYRALFKLSRMPENQPAPVMVTVDLRQYMPEGSQIRAVNFSSAFNVLLPYIEGESFLESLRHVARLTSNLKESHGEIPIAVILELYGIMGLSEARRWFESARKQSIDTNLATPHLSNIGVINKLIFGNLSAAEGYIVTPAMYAPGFMLGASTYSHVLTLVVNYYTSDIEEELVQSFLNYMVSGLEECISHLVPELST
ncbi:MAG: condensation domain-containing protein [Bacillota bacterium]